MKINNKIKMLGITTVMGAAIFVGAESASAASVKVERGDSLSLIAKEQGTTVANLKTLNNLKSNTIYVGQTLKVNNNAVVQTAKKATNVSSVYKIQKGDTLTKIAKKYNLTVKDLKSLNGMNTDKIYVGQTLKVSGKVATASTTQNTAKQAVVTAKKPSTVQSTTNGVRQAIVDEAKKYIGTKYKWGGTTTAGFDCSGFIYYVLKQEGISNKRYTTASYLSAAKKISEPQIGDLVFFQNTYRKGVSHIGIYVGDGKMIHAGNDGVKVETFKSGYWAGKFLSYGTMVK